MSDLEKGRKAVTEMKNEGWCEGCNCNCEDCYLKGKCMGGEKDGDEEKSV